MNQEKIYKNFAEKFYSKEEDLTPYTEDMIQQAVTGAGMDQRIIAQARANFFNVQKSSSTSDIKIPHSWKMAPSYELRSNSMVKDAGKLWQAEIKIVA